MEILIIVPRYNLTNKQNFFYNFPLGLAYISSTIKNAGYNVDCLNMNHFSGESEVILKRVLSKKKYDVVCTGGNSLIYSILESIIKSTRKFSPQSKIIVGGPIITSEPELMVKSLRPDVGVIGEGEATILESLKCIRGNNNFNEVKGIAYFEKGELKINGEREFIKDIDSIPYPDLDGLGFSEHIENNICNLNYMHNCLDNPRTYPILASRGCPFNCSFCWHPERNRKRSMKNIILEIEFAIKKYKINNILLYDDCFSATKERVYEFCKEIKKLSKKHNCNLKWTCQLMVFSVDYDLLKTMKDAGCESISYGFESFSPIVLKSMRKPITPELIDKAFKETLKARIGVQANFILGDIAETKETARTTLDYWEKECKGQIGIGFVQPYPGSDLYKYCINNKIIKDKLHYIKYDMGPSNAVKMTKNLSEKDFNNLEKKILGLFSKYVRFVIPKKLKKVNKSKNLYDVDVKCPFCKKEIVYGKCYVQNKNNYGFNLICRNCGYRFFVVSFLQKLAYKNYPLIRGLRDYYSKLLRKIKQKNI
jgi:radical SAM superfamily enzyme YgiQ (UPF0313 family)